MKTSIITAIAAAIALTPFSAFAEENNMDKCKVVKDGKGMIKASKSDCATASHSCAGQNAAGDAEAWLKVPKGQCEKINAGDFSGIDQVTKDKIEGAK